MVFVGRILRIKKVAWAKAHMGSIGYIVAYINCSLGCSLGWRYTHRGHQSPWAYRLSRLPCTM